MFCLVPCLAHKYKVRVVSLTSRLLFPCFQQSEVFQYSNYRIVISYPNRLSVKQSEIWVRDFYKLD